MIHLRHAIDITRETSLKLALQVLSPLLAATKPGATNVYARPCHVMLKPKPTPRQQSPPAVPTGGCSLQVFRPLCAGNPCSAARCRETAPRLHCSPCACRFHARYPPTAAYHVKGAVDGQREWTGYLVDCSHNESTPLYVSQRQLEHTKWEDRSRVQVWKGRGRNSEEERNRLTGGMAHYCSLWSKELPYRSGPHGDA